MSKQNDLIENLLVPSIVKKNPNGGEKVYDVYSYLLQDRVIFFNYEFTAESCSLLCAQLLALEGENNDPIYILINSPGGEVYSGLSVIDMISRMKSQVIGIGTGVIASMGSVLLTACDIRYMTENARMMIHQPSGGARGKFTDLEVTMMEMGELYKIIRKIYREHSVNISDDELTKLMTHDFWFGAHKALEMGFIDEILPRAVKVKK